MGDHEPAEAAVDQQPPQQDALHLEIQEIMDMPGRDLSLPRLHPTHQTGTIWFDRDKGVLVRAITKIIKQHYDGPYYNWTVTPQHKKNEFYIAFARRFTWAIDTETVVRHHFFEICRRRLKGTVYAVKAKKIRPVWIRDELWEQMKEHWASRQKQQRNKIVDHVE